jgi:uncharacterized coiled-coil protein SlyX
MRDEGMAEDLRHVEVLGRLILRTIHRLERQMADQNVTTQEILDAVRAQRGQLASLSTLVAGIKARLNDALAGEISPAAQAKLNDIMSEIQGNSRAITDAVATNDDDPSTVASDGTGGPINEPGPGQTEPAPEPAPTAPEAKPEEPAPASPGVAATPAT